MKTTPNQRQECGFTLSDSQKPMEDSPKSQIFQEENKTKQNKTNVGIFLILLRSVQDGNPCLLREKKRVQTMVLGTISAGETRAG